MRFLTLLSLVLTLATACTKKPTKDPIPAIEWVDFRDAGRSQFTGSDTATIVLRYEDGDGDIFVNNFSDNANLIITPYHWDAALGRFVATFNPDPTFNDTIRQPHTIKHPDSEYYKNKAIRGEIFVPLTSFRENPNQRILKFTGFMVDMKGHKSNIFSSPSYTLNF